MGTGGRSDRLLSRSGSDRMIGGMGGVDFWELVVILVIAILVWGEKMPSAARNAARWYSRFRRQMSLLREEIWRAIPEEEESPETERHSSRTAHDSKTLPESGPAPGSMSETSLPERTDPPQ